MLKCRNEEMTAVPERSKTALKDGDVSRVVPLELIRTIQAHYKTKTLT
jgi:hypothetical protein